MSSREPESRSPSGAADDSPVSTSPGVYVHVPFCSAICPYCDFSVLTGDERSRATYVDALERELRTWSEEAWPASFDTIYLGGGTPSSLAPELLARILQVIPEALDTVDEPWIQLEANPEDVDAARVTAWRELGVDVLSLGVQSFDDARLAFLGRRHDGRRSLEAVETALSAGFASVSIDLIFGLPDQSADEWERELEAAVSAGPHHISCYQLTIHEGTPFGFRRDRGRLGEMPDDEQARLLILTHRRLAEHGYEAYEVSNFARSPELRSRHNPKYWSHVPYLGIGPSAHSLRGRTRWWNERKTGAWRRALYENRSPIAGSEELSTAQLLLERLMLGLRTPAGVDFDLLERQHGCDLWSPNASLLERMARSGLVDLVGRTVRPTLRGIAIADGLTAALDVPAQGDNLLR